MGNSKQWLEMTPEKRKIKRKEYNDRYKEKHPERVIEQDKAYKERNREKIRIKGSAWQKEKGRKNKIKAIEYLGGQCNDCTGKYLPAVYDFHHLDPKTKDSTMARIMGRSWENLITELDKCVLLCANCHRVRHSKENE